MGQSGRLGSKYIQLSCVKYIISGNMLQCTRSSVWCSVWQVLGRGGRGVHEGGIYVFISGQFSQCVRHFVTPWTTAHQASLSITNSQSLPKLMSIELVMPSNHLILCRPLLLLLSIFQSALCIGWPMYWSFSFNITPSNEHPGPISFRMDWLDLLAVQGTLKSLLQHHSSKASILQWSAFFIVQLSLPYMTTEKA